MSVVTPPVESKKIVNFFWHHLERDFEILCKAIGKSFDEAALLVHIVLQQILKVNPDIGLIGTIIWNNPYFIKLFFRSIGYYSSINIST